MVQISTAWFNVEILGASNPHDVEISWLACLAEKSGVTTGCLGDGGNTGIMQCESYFAFKTNQFKAPPRVFAGITGFGMIGNLPLFLCIEVVQVTCEGMKWCINGETEGSHLSVKGSFIAFE